MRTYDFSSQSELFQIALEILEDYEINSWSLGGGTTLSVLHYQHRMSYDIDIFLEDYSEIQRILTFQNEIAANLGIDDTLIQASTTGITFILDDEGYGLKLDFVYSPALTQGAYEYKDIFGHSGVKVQTAKEIIAKKLKFREKATIRDFVDYAIAQRQDEILSKLKSESIVDIDRYFDVIEKFNGIKKSFFDQELEGLMPGQNIVKEDFEETINALMQPGDVVTVALDYTGEVVAFDEFIEGYRALYAELGNFEVFSIRNPGLSYREILRLDKGKLEKLKIDRIQFLD
ncbi:nucleotidyl transferase AbiEii/AbiGii toxin family protein [Nitratifractor sp.]